MNGHATHLQALTKLNGERNSKQAVALPGMIVDTHCGDKILPLCRHSKTGLSKEPIWGGGVVCLFRKVLFLIRVQIIELFS